MRVRDGQTCLPPASPRTRPPEPAPTRPPQTEPRPVRVVRFEESSFEPARERKRRLLEEP
jgi:hypothetical protein